MGSLLKEIVDTQKFDIWIEPFMGSGVVGFNIASKNAVFGDANPYPIDFYNSIKKGVVNPFSVKKFLEEEGSKLSEQGEKHYYFVRERFNREHSPFDFLFLNRSDFNGMIRFSKTGKFNVPFGHKPERFAKAYITKICNQIELQPIIGFLFANPSRKPSNQHRKIPLYTVILLT